MFITGVAPQAAISLSGTTGAAIASCGFLKLPIRKWHWEKMNSRNCIKWSMIFAYDRISVCRGWFDPKEKWTFEYCYRIRYARKNRCSGFLLFLGEPLMCKCATPAILHTFGIRWFSRENHYFLMCVRVNKSELLSCEQERVLTFWPLYHIISSRRMRGKWFEKLDWAEERTWGACCPATALEEVDWDIWGIKSTKTYSWLSCCARCSLR